jgi:hypothetical protein
MLTLLREGGLLALIVGTSWSSAIVPYPLFHPDTAGHEHAN